MNPSFFHVRGVLLAAASLTLPAAANPAYAQRLDRWEGDRVEWNAMSADETAAAFDEIRRIDDLLNRVETATGR